MNNTKQDNLQKGENREKLSEKIEKSAKRKYKAQQRRKNKWLYLGVVGSIGWLVVVPTLVGAAAGLWLDRHFPQALSQALALMLAGLAVGCFNAWRWVEQERKNIEEEGEDNE
ncbi:MAG: F0F1 ATP synthase subunit [Negativicutes bacterium]|nr:F0F1 ATP synthase subunit [Negativicutes bacterium]